MIYDTYVFAVCLVGTVLTVALSLETSAACSFRPASSVWDGQVSGQWGPYPFNVIFVTRTGSVFGRCRVQPCLSMIEGDIAGW